MQTKKKAGGKISSCTPMSPKASRLQKKVSEHVQVSEKKASELITSSARKQKPAGVQLKKARDHVPTTNLTALYDLMEDDASNVSLGDNATNSVASECVAHAHVESFSDHMPEVIFSPTFHISKNVGVDIDNRADFIKFFKHGNADLQDSEKENSLIEMLNCNGVKDSTEDITKFTSMTSPGIGSNLSPEASAIYVSMKNSRLECVEQDSDEMPADVCVEDDEFEEFDDFDPYLFIRNLPDLSAVVPTFRPVLLPKQTRSCPRTTLVLDLDETLVHSTLEPCGEADFTFPVHFNMQEHTVYVRCRPHLKDFMERISSLFEIIIFTASQSIYAEQLLNVLDPKRRVFRHRVYRESCVFVEGNYLKDLTVLGRDLARVIIVDNSPQAFGFQVDNGIPIESWFDDRSDQELLSLLPFLESLVGVEDVRPLIAKRFNLRQRIAACPSTSIITNAYER